MDNILDFLANWYVLFIIISIILIFALIGYFVERKRSKPSPFKIASDKDIEDQMNIDNLKNMSGNVSLSEALNKNVITPGNTQGTGNQGTYSSNNTNNPSEML